MLTKKAYLYFAKSETERPIVYRLVKDYDLVVNIFRAKVTGNDEGYLSLDLTGTEENLERALAYLRTFDIEIHLGDKGLFWDEARCTHCTNCVAHCPTNALHVADPRTRRVAFAEDRCVECLACITNCPYGVCSSRF